MSDSHEIPSLVFEHTGLLEELTELPPYLLPDGGSATGAIHYSCAFCGVGDAAMVVQRESAPAPEHPLATGPALLVVPGPGRDTGVPVTIDGAGRIVIDPGAPGPAVVTLLTGQLKQGDSTLVLIARPVPDSGGRVFERVTTQVKATDRVMGRALPTAGCVKLGLSRGHQRPVYPFHKGPSALETPGGPRRPVDYAAAVSRLADLLLAHRPPRARTLVYGCGQIDYFTVFALQEITRLLTCRNITGNAEHCLNAGAVHNEILTGQEGPFLTIAAALAAPGAFYLFNGWNGLITHPPVFHQLLKRPDIDAYLVEVAVTESARALATRLSGDRVLLIRPGSDPQLALAVANQVLATAPHALDQRFLGRFADAATFEAYRALAGSDEYQIHAVARRIAPEPDLVDRLERGIEDIAAKIVRAGTVPINIPSVGLSQTKGVVAHSLWGNLLAMVGKYGLAADGSIAGGTLRIPGQINAESEVQGLSRNVFMGRIKMTEEGARDASLRMDLPPDAYSEVIKQTPTAALDYSDPTGDTRELILCIGTQFESNMMNRERWVAKLRSPEVTLVVMDPIPDPFSLAHAALSIPSPPHVAAAKLYQNGEWRLSVSHPTRRAPAQTRTDATILYDAMAEITRKLDADPQLAAQHPDLARHLASGYLRRRFLPPEEGGALPRIAGEVSRPVLWQRVLDYMGPGEGRIGPLYCRPVHADGRAISWADLMGGSVVYGGVGSSRYRLDYEKPGHHPFGDIYGRPRGFTFFVPTAKDLALPEGILMTSGRSTLTDDRERIRFATSTFNSGKATPVVGMPDENPIFISLTLADRLGLSTGDRARVTGEATGQSLILPVVVTDRVRGESVYVSFHKTKAEVHQGRYLNALTDHLGRCPYSSQSNFKVTRVSIVRVQRQETHHDPTP